MKNKKKINEFISLKLEGRRTFIYVAGKRFIQCIRLILNIQKDVLPRYDEIESIDEAAQIYNQHLYQNRAIQNHHFPHLLNQASELTTEQEFWGHCSNIQAWVEHDYDTRILMSNISFPLLRELTIAGDPKARRVYKEQIALRLESGYPSVVQYLLAQGYLQVFTTEEFQSILEATPIIKNLSSDFRILFYFLTSCLKYFPSLMEEILLKILKLPDGKNILISSLKRSENRPLSGRDFMFNRYQSLVPSILYQLKTHLEHLLLRYEENLGDDITDCIHYINEVLLHQTGSYQLKIGDDKAFDENLQARDHLRDMLLEEREMADFLELSLERAARCSYCGRVIPHGQDVCDWCGHKRDDDDDFFPYPYIFKPPNGGGGARSPSMKVYPVVKNEY